MIGLLGFLADTTIVFIIPTVVITEFYTWLGRKRSLVITFNLVISLAIAMFVEPLLVSRYYLKTTNYFALSQLQAENVSSIIVGSKTWDKPEDIRILVANLERANWVVPLGGIGSIHAVEPLTVSFNSGNTLQLCVGRHYFGGETPRDEAIIGYYNPGSNCEATGALAIAPGLLSMLENLNYSLP